MLIIICKVTISFISQGHNEFLTQNEWSANSVFVAWMNEREVQESLHKWIVPFLCSRSYSAPFIFQTEEATTSVYTKKCSEYDDNSSFHTKHFPSLRSHLTLSVMSVLGGRNSLLEMGEEVHGENPTCHGQHSGRGASQLPGYCTGWGQRLRSCQDREANKPSDSWGQSWMGTDRMDPDYNLRGILLLKECWLDCAEMPESVGNQTPSGYLLAAGIRNLEAEASLLLGGKLGDTEAAQLQTTAKLVDDRLIHSEHCSKEFSPQIRTGEQFVLGVRGQRSNGKNPCNRRVCNRLPSVIISSLIRSSPKSHWNEC